MARDPITQPASNASGSPKNTSGDRIKSISGGGANFTKSNDTKGLPSPSSPYSK